MDIRRRLNNPDGVTILAVLFVLLALGALGVTVSKVAENQARQASSAVGVEDTFYTAQSGLEWGVQQVVDNPGFTPPYTQITGPRTMPNGDTFTLAYDSVTDTLSSTATKGAHERMLTLGLFAQVIQGAGGGGGPTDPNDTCPSSHPSQGGGDGFDLFATYLASAGDNVNGITSGAHEGINPDNFSIPSFPTGVAYPNHTYSGGTTNLSSSTPTANNPELYYNNLTLDDHGTINITGPTGAGNYLTVWVKGDFRVQDHSTLNVTGNVRFIVGTSARDDENVRVSGHSSVNITNGNLLLMASGDFKAVNESSVNAGGSASNLLIMALDDIRSEDNGTIKGGMYAHDDINIEDRPTVSGAMVAEDDITVHSSHATVSHDATAGQSVINNIKTC